MTKDLLNDNEVIEFCGCGASVRFPHGGHTSGLLREFRLTHRCMPVTVEEADPVSTETTQGDTPVGGQNGAVEATGSDEPKPVAVVGTIVNSGRKFGFA